MKHLLILILLTISLYSNNKEVILQLNWKNQFQFAGYYIAKELGYYKDIGLDVHIKEFEYGMNTTDIILADKAHFAVGRSSLIIDKSNGKDIVALAAIYQDSPLMLLVREDSGINNIQDFRNKKIMVTNDAKSTVSILAMLQSNGIYKNDFIRQEHSFNLQDLIDRKTDAMASYISNEPIRLHKQNISYKIFHPKDYGFNFYSDILFTSTKFLNENEKLVKDFYQATIKGWEYAFNNITTTSEIIYKKYNTQNKTQLDYILEGEELKKLAYHNDTKDIGSLDKKVVKQIVNTYKVLGFLKNEFDIDDFIYKENVHKMIDIELSYKDVTLISIIIILLVALLVIFLFFLSIKSKLLRTNKALKEEVKSQTKKIREQHKIILTQTRVVAVGEMMANIAHQWRQPLNSITLHASGIQLSMKSKQNPSDEMLNTSMQKIVDKCKYLSQTIDDFRDFLKSDSTKKEYINLDETINKVLNLTNNILENNQIKIVKKYSSNYSVNTNEAALSQVLLNLINNSYDALVLNNIPDADRLIFIETKKENDKFHITVKDSGGGIKKDIFYKMFEPYTTTKFKSEGTGIGLYMTYKLVTEQIEGEIIPKNVTFEYNNKKLTGAEFTIIL